MRYSMLSLCFCFTTLLGACLTEELRLCDQENYPWECTCPDAQAKLKKAFDYYDLNCDVCKSSPMDPMCKEPPPKIDGGADAGKDGGGRDGALPDGAADDGGADPDAAPEDGGPDQCSVRCEGSTPNCDLETGNCEECNADGHCETAGAPRCVAHACVECRAGEAADCAESELGPVCVDGACVECASHTDCADPTEARCNADEQCVPCDDDAQCTGRLDGEGDALAQCVSGACVECESHADCGDPKKAMCNASHVCVPCDDDLQCDGRENGDGDPIEVCDAGECVECTGLKYDACLSGATQYVCDSLQRTCSDKVEASAFACQPCVSDAQCVAGHQCMRTKFGTEETGLFCLWREDAVTGSNCANVRPFIGVESTWLSVDLGATTVCRLASTTCQGYGDFKKTCSSADAAGDAMCGAVGFPDAYCAANGGGFLCTTPCGGDNDCQDIVAHNDECQPQSVSAGATNVCVFQ